MAVARDDHAMSPGAPSRRADAAASPRPSSRARRAGATPAALAAPDGSLVARLVAGEEAAYAELVREHGPVMRAAAARFSRSPADVEDALQDAYLCVIRGIRAFAGECRLDTWLYRLTMNCARMRLRSQRRSGETFAKAASQLLSERSRGENSAAADDMSRREFSENVRAALGRLDPAARTALLLREVAGLPLSEVARVLGVQAACAKMRVHRARAALRAEVARPAPGTFASRRLDGSRRGRAATPPRPRPAFALLRRALLEDAHAPPVPPPARVRA
jgi:RNA polymerase sigma-70 factor (ECF subfamily)